jgi:hypothetical protein
MLVVSDGVPMVVDGWALFRSTAYEERGFVRVTTSVKFCW